MKLNPKQVKNLISMIENYLPSYESSEISFDTLVDFIDPFEFRIMIAEVIDSNKDGE